MSTPGDSRYFKPSSFPNGERIRRLGITIPLGLELAPSLHNPIVQGTVCWPSHSHNIEANKGNMLFRLVSIRHLLESLKRYIFRVGPRNQISDAMSNKLIRNKRHIVHQHLKQLIAL